MLDKIMPTPKVSMCIVCYNQKKYISECILSILNQKTDFPFEIIVSDDASTDGSSAIISRLAAQYPKIIKAVIHQKNIGAHANYRFTHNLAEGEYICHVDGDDILFPGKLALQARFLDDHPECVIAWHRMSVINSGVPVKVVIEERELEEDLKAYDPCAEYYSAIDYINFTFIGANSSKMYRKSVRRFHENTKDCFDFRLNELQLTEGIGALLGGRPLGAYRVGVGITSAGNKVRTVVLEWLTELLDSKDKYKRYRAAINSAALHYTLSDIIHLSPTFPKSLRLFIKTFYIEGISLYIKTYKKRRSFIIK